MPPLNFNPLALLNIGEVALFFLLWFFISLPIVLPLAITLRWRPGKLITPAQKIPLLLVLYLLAPVALWSAGHLSSRITSGKGFGAYGLVWNGTLGSGLVGGLLLAIAGVALWLGVQLSLGWVIWQPAALTPRAGLTIAAVALLGLFVGLIEELIFRGFLPLVLSFELETLPSVAIASILFALLHLVWEGRANLPQLPGLTVMGLVLSAACWVEGGNLGLAWGLHAGWIGAIASLDTLSSLAPTGRVPAWITGIDGKPLAGALGLLLLLGTASILWISASIGAPWLGSL